jgi:hypothetical protein
MKAAYLVTESREAANLLQQLLPSDLLRSVEIVSAGQKYAAVSLAGTIMSERSRPVLLVIDAESDNVAQAKAREQEIRAMLLPAASVAPYEVCVAVPSIGSLIPGELDADRRRELQQLPLVQRIVQFLSGVFSQVA